MAEYLLPNYQNITIDDQRSIFALRNRMVFIPSNFPNDKKDKAMCPCGETENMNHIYSCKLWSKENMMNNPQYEMIFSDNISEQVKVNKIFNMNYQTRENYQIKMKNQKSESKPHEIQYCDPLSSMFENSNG